MTMHPYFIKIKAVELGIQYTLVHKFTGASLESYMVVSEDFITTQRELLTMFPLVILELAKRNSIIYHDLLVSTFGFVEKSDKPSIHT